MDSPKSKPRVKSRVSDPEISLKTEPVPAYLSQFGVDYDVICHAKTNTLEEAAAVAAVDLANIIRAVILKSGSFMVMAILPAAKLLDFRAICSQLGRELEVAKLKDLNKIFKKCEAGSYPPLPELFSMNAIIDKQVFEIDPIYFEPGDHTALIKISNKSWRQLLINFTEGDFAADVSSLSQPEFVDFKQGITSTIAQFTPTRFHKRITETFELPMMPPIVDRLLKLRMDPNSAAGDLAVLVEQDPSLAAQVICWARSPYYGFPGTVESVQDAIIKVLGFDLVMNLALGIAVSKTMTMAAEGPLGLKNYWKHAIYTATLTEKLLGQMPIKTRLSRGLVYLAGLLHNFGHLILGQVFKPQFFLLNRYVSVNSQVAVNKIEQYVLGVSHEQIGAWLMHSWHMPREIIDVVKWHHQEDYAGDNAIYVKLVLVANRLLKNLGLGDDANQTLPSASLEFLGLGKKELDTALEQLLDQQQDLDALTRILVV